MELWSSLLMRKYIYESSGICSLYPKRNLLHQDVFFWLWMGNQAPVLPSQGLGCKNWCINPARLADGLCWLCPEAEVFPTCWEIFVFQFNSEVSKTFIKKSPGQIFFYPGDDSPRNSKRPHGHQPLEWILSKGEPPRNSVQHWQPQVVVPHQKKTH